MLSTAARVGRPLSLLILASSIIGGVRRRTSRKPVAPGRVYDVEIVELSRRGDGLARIEGFVVFVPGTKPGAARQGEG